MTEIFNWILEIKSSDEKWYAINSSMNFNQKLHNKEICLTYNEIFNLDIFKVGQENFCLFEDIKKNGKKIVSESISDYTEYYKKKFYLSYKINFFNANDIERLKNNEKLIEWTQSLHNVLNESSQILSLPGEELSPHQKMDNAIIFSKLPERNLYSDNWKIILILKD